MLIELQRRDQQANDLVTHEVATGEASLNWEAVCRQVGEHLDRRAYAHSSSRGRESNAVRCEGSRLRLASLSGNRTSRVAGGGLPRLLLGPAPSCAPSGMRWGPRQRRKSIAADSVSAEQTQSALA